MSAGRGAPRKTSAPRAATPIGSEYHPSFRRLLRKLHIRPVWTPTESSWLNLIEAHFGVLRRFAVANTDDLDHIIRRRRIYRYLRYGHKKRGRLRHSLNCIRTIRLGRGPRVTVKVSGMPWNELLENVLVSNGLGFVIEKNLLFIAHAENLGAIGRYRSRTYGGQPINLNFLAGRLEELLFLFSDITGFRLVLDENLKGRGCTPGTVCTSWYLTLRVSERPSMEVLDLVLIANDLAATWATALPTRSLEPRPCGSAGPPTREGTRWTCHGWCRPAPLSRGKNRSDPGERAVVRFQPVA